MCVSVCVCVCVCVCGGGGGGGGADSGGVWEHRAKDSNAFYFESILHDKYVPGGGGGADSGGVWETVC